MWHNWLKVRIFCKVCLFKQLNSYESMHSYFTLFCKLCDTLFYLCKKLWPYQYFSFCIWFNCNYWDILEFLQKSNIIWLLSFILSWKNFSYKSLLHSYCCKSVYHTFVSIFPLLFGGFNSKFVYDVLYRFLWPIP